MEQWYARAEKELFARMGSLGREIESSSGSLLRAGRYCWAVA